MRWGVRVFELGYRVVVGVLVLTGLGDPLTWSERRFWE